MEDVPLYDTNYELLSEITGMIANPELTSERILNKGFQCQVCELASVLPVLG